MIESDKSKWEFRTEEIANLLNPAFCCLLVQDVVVAYSKENENSIPFSLIYFILPIVLHKETRESLPVKKTTSMHSWISNKQHLKIGFSERIINLKTITNEAIFFGCQNNVLTFDDNGIASKKQIKKSSWKKETETYQCRKKATFLGKWFALNDETSIYLSWGVIP